MMIGCGWLCEREWGGAGTNVTPKLTNLPTQLPHSPKQNQINRLRLLGPGAGLPRPGAPRPQARRLVLPAVPGTHARLVSSSIYFCVSGWAMKALHYPSVLSFPNQTPPIPSQPPNHPLPPTTTTGAAARVAARARHGLRDAGVHAVGRRPPLRPLPPRGGLRRQRAAGKCARILALVMWCWLGGVGVCVVRGGTPI